MNRGMRVLQLCSIFAAALVLLGCSNARRGAGTDGMPAFRGPWARLAFPNAGAAPTRMDLVLAFENLEFDRPVFLTHAGDGSDRLFVVEQPGRIRIIQDGQLLDEPFLDITDRVDSGGERGLLGLAFPPDAA